MARYAIVKNNWCGPIMVLERIANPSIGESRFLSSSLSRTAKLKKEIVCQHLTHTTTQ
jgi:hypothetical protein